LEEGSLNEFLPLRNRIYHQFHQRGGVLDDSNLPELAMYYSKLSFVPPMNRDELNELYFQGNFQEKKERSILPSTLLNRIHPFTNNKGVEFNHLIQFKMDILYFEDGRIKNKKNHEFLKELKALSTHYSSLESVWMVHGKNNFTYPYFLFLCLSIMLDIPCFICQDTNMIPKELNPEHHLIVTSLFHFGKEYNHYHSILSNPSSGKEEKREKKESMFQCIQVENGNKFIQLNHEMVNQLESKLSFGSFKTGD
jgi:hypothetical protein